MPLILDSSIFTEYKNQERPWFFPNDFLPIFLEQSSLGNFPKPPRGLLCSCVLVAPCDVVAVITVHHYYLRFCVPLPNGKVPEGQTSYLRLGDL